MKTKITLFSTLVLLFIATITYAQESFKVVYMSKETKYVSHHKDLNNEVTIDKRHDFINQNDGTKLYVAKSVEEFKANLLMDSFLMRLTAENISKTKFVVLTDDPTLIGKEVEVK